MNSHNPNGWPPGTAPGQVPPAQEPQPIQQRPPGSFGPGVPMQQGPQHQLNGPAIVQQSTPFFTNQQGATPNAQNLPSQASPMQSVRGPAPPPHAQQQSPGGLPHPPSQQHYGLPALGPSISQQSPQAILQAERELILQREQQDRMRQEQIHHEIVQHQRFEQERELLSQQHDHQLRIRDQLQREQAQREQLQSPRENHAGAIPLQQPVASRVPATLHGPNGILNEQHIASAPQPQPAQPLGAPSGPGNVFGGSIQASNEGNLRPFPQQVAHNLSGQQQLINLTNAAAPQPSNGSMTQSQQPILNDALSYLDQVKVRFQDQPEVYNRFLDIMKDFKSQAIDTPGVIERVSGLFTGHPELIQGFNTFLPPGYKIECGLDDDPNSIRVTTPMGTTVQQVPSVNRFLPNGVAGPDHPRSAFYTNGHPNNDWVAQQQEIDQQEVGYGGGRQHGMTLFAGQSSLAEAGTPFDEQSDIQALPVGLAQNQHLLGGLEKRGPVEFNHAIGYVNKIKNRFQDSPEIYKQFLEILQTYQKESKPIQDVYAQVTQLFSSAQDLLEDFKQFLPESAAQAKAQAQAAAKQAEDAAMLSNVRGEASYSAGQLHNQTQTPRPELKMPPVGSFAPPSVGKDNKKRRGGAGSQITGGAAGLDGGAAPNGRNRGNVGNANKRARIEQAKPAAPEIIPVEPNLIPALPTPMPPAKDKGPMIDGITFFERVKKYLANRQTFNEFLKLCNLFNQQIIEKQTLVHKAHGFIGANVDLMSYFKKWVLHDGNDRVIENSARIPSGKVVLSNCRGLGPSYRLLPKRERLRACGGRDNMCRAVLNDEWVSHPTWASEESGFIAHRKNNFEESLHRIEEERHDYDINIEACLRTIQLLEPIAQQMKTLSDEDKYNFRLAPGIGGQSETIYQRVIKKIYDRERGQKVVRDMFERPTSVIPILLGRLKQKSEEWKASQREWEKVWREQTNRIFWKSLDHQGISAKQADKRQFQPKTLHTEIQAKYEEQRRQKTNPSNRPAKWQFEYDFSDLEVVYDCCHLILTFLHHGWIGNEVDKTRLDSFIKTLIPTFFDIDREAFEEKMNDIEDVTPPSEEVEEDPNADADAESTVIRGRRGGNTKKQDLLRGVLDRSTRRGDDAEESGASTPDIHSNGDDTPATTGTLTELPRADPTEHRWMAHPLAGTETVNLTTPFHREDFHLYATSNIYCFFRMFQGLYERLLRIKTREQRVHQDVSRANTEKPANDLGLVDKLPSDYFADVSPLANYYKQVVQMCENVTKNEMETPHLEEILRRFYMQDGWQLYSFDKLVAALTRFAIQILVSDNKDKSLDIINLFYKDRKEDETTHQNELNYRKQVEKHAKDAEIYRIRYNRPTRTASIQIFKKDDKTYEADELAAAARWSYYISTYSMLDHTEGVPFADISLPYLRRTMPFPRRPRLANPNSNPSSNEKATEKSSTTATVEDLETLTKDFSAVPMWNQDGLMMRISPNNYHLLYDPWTADWWVQSIGFQKRGLGAHEQRKEKQKENFQSLIESKEKNPWMQGLEDGEIQKVKDAYASWIGRGANGVEGVEGESRREEEADAAAAVGGFD